MFSSTTILFALAFFVNSFCSSVLAGPPSIKEQALKYYAYRQDNRFVCSLALQQRREWYASLLSPAGKNINPSLNPSRRTLSNLEKADYIKAVKCLQSHPARDPAMPEAKTRFDEFQAYHIVLADKIHNLVRLHFHRNFHHTLINIKYKPSRVNFCHGTGTTSGVMRKDCATSADTTAPSRQYP